MIKISKDLAAINAYLQDKNWLKEDQKVQATEVPGEGNMNFTLRCKVSDGSTFIIKQSREYVEKYPQVAAPAERVNTEAEFYNMIGKKERIQARMPQIIGLDSANNIMLMEDLGEGTDFTHIYQRGDNMEEDDLMELVDYLCDLHSAFSIASTDEPIYNRKMRQLNHEHIFHFPYLNNNGMNLDDVMPGLQQAAADLRKDEALKKKVKEMGELYLSDGEKLLHGDFFPGSWLKTTDGIKVIDPEFCFFGIPEFELGIMAAHLKMAQQPDSFMIKAIKTYQESVPMDEDLMGKFQAIEILRRLMGLAQLPLTLTLAERLVLMETSQKILLS